MLNAIALSSHRVSEQYNAHCASSQSSADDCDELAALVTRALFSTAVLHSLLLADAVGVSAAARLQLSALANWAISLPQRLPPVLSPTTYTTCLFTIVGRSTHILRANHASNLFEEFFDEIQLLLTLWSGGFSWLFSSLGTILNWWLVADWIVLIYGCVQYVRGLRRELGREPDLLRAARKARDRVGRRTPVEQREPEPGDSCAICLDDLLPSQPSSATHVPDLGYCRFGCGKPCHSSCLQRWLHYSQRCPNCLTHWQRTNE
mmetsp:Transcript_24141/g.62185  ORF Transcript_24141/g.62185 Transcript_24141/m.62185 type:complete len:262 (+) Transcript_24141:89-874(+)